MRRCAIISINVFLRVQDGYRRRRPFWSRESWRRYLTASLLPFCAFAIMAAMAVAVDLKLPITGDGGSFARGMWVAGMLIFMLLGAAGLVIAVEWLHQGEPSRQFVLPSWLVRQHDKTA